MNKEIFKVFWGFGICSATFRPWSDKESISGWLISIELNFCIYQLHLALAMVNKVLKVYKNARITGQNTKQHCSVVTRLNEWPICSKRGSIDMINSPEVIF